MELEEYKFLLKNINSEIESKYQRIKHLYAINFSLLAFIFIVIINKNNSILIVNTVNNYVGVISFYITAVSFVLSLCWSVVCSLNMTNQYVCYKKCLFSSPQNVLCCIENKIDNFNIREYLLTQIQAKEKYLMRLNNNLNLTVISCIVCLLSTLFWFANSVNLFS